MNQKRKKTKEILILFSSILMSIFLFLCFVSLYNEVLKPFEHKTYYHGTDKNEDEIMKMPFYEKYVKNNFDNYDCMIFSRRGKNSMLPQITVLYFYYSFYSYSVTFDLNEDFSSINSEYISNLDFVKMPIGHKESLHYIDSIEINNWIFKEIKYGYELAYHDNKMINWYYENFRENCYFYGYNESTKQISFSILMHDPSLDYIDNEEELSKYFKKNFPI